MESETRRRVPTGFALALGIAVAGSLGSLLLSLGLGLRACPLCFYQRSFMMAVAVVLGFGWWLDRSRCRSLALLATPLAVAGLGVAAFHEYLVVSSSLECPYGLLGLGSAPAQSLAVFLGLTICLCAAAVDRSAHDDRTALSGLAVATSLGLMLAWASVASAPPLPAAPNAPYDPVQQPLNTCRPPYVSDPEPSA